MQPIRLKTEAAANALYRLALGLSLVFALYFAVQSLFHTYVLDPAHYASQHLYEVDENELTNLCATALGLGLLSVFYRKARISARTLKAVCCILLPLYGAAGILWVLGAKAIPSSDPGIIIDSARLLLAGEFAPFRDPAAYIHFYYLRFPFQFGFLAYIELLMRIFGERGLLVAAPVMNVLSLLCGDIAILKTTQEIFSDRKLTCITLLFLCAALQPLLGCTLVYGTYPAYALAMWAVFFVCRYMRRGKKRDAALAAVFLAFATLMKANAGIVAVAAAIALLVHALKNRKTASILAAALMLLSILPLPKAAQALYEKRVGAEYGDGLSKLAWMAMSSQNSSMAAGWYSMYSWRIYEEAGRDMERAAALSREDLIGNYRGFWQDPERGKAFFHEKLCSQWNENTFQSVWTSRVCDAYGEVAPTVQSAYGGRLKAPLEFIMNQYVQFIYCAYALGILSLLLGRYREGALLFPLILLGAVLFHALFEAKAQYALTYLPQFAPVAALGASFAYAPVKDNKSLPA